MALTTVWGGSAAAEINVGESLEWMVADADGVVRARVVDFGVAKGEGHWVRLKVAETLKGKHRPQIKVVSRGFGSDKVLAGWKASGTELLVMLKADPGHAGWTHSMRPSHGDVWAIELNDAPHHGAFTMDFEDVQDSDRILALARSAATQKGAKPEVINVDVPFGSPIFSRLYGGSSVWLQVPLDERLVLRARTWVGAKEGRARLDGIKVLSHFKSPQHAVLLKGLLRDEQVWTVTDSKGSGKRYMVREAAFEVLEKWGVKVAKPSMKP